MEFQPENLVKKIGFDAIRQATQAFAVSAMGRERLAGLKPSIKREKIERRLTRTAEMMELLETGAAFPLENLHDVREQTRSSKAKGSQLSLETFRHIREVSATARRIKSFIEGRKKSYPHLAELSIGLIPLKKLEKQIRAVINEQGALRSDASPELRRIHNRLNRQRDALRKTVNRVMATVSGRGMTTDESPTLHGGRMVIPVEAKHKNKIKGFVHGVSSTGQTVYLEPVEALEINNEIRQLESEEKREIDRILRALTVHVRSRRESIIQNCETLGRFDAITARARLSMQCSGSTPALSDDGHLHLKEAYNPLLQLKNKRLNEDEREPVVPLNLELDEDEQCLVITGPNAGGKSVAMKTLGLCVMMNQAGYAIPVRDSSKLPVYDQLFLDMGDQQSIENDLSSFSSRLQWMKQTRARAGKNSLILIDEAAADTDPEEGEALFQAFVKELIRSGAKIIATTHHGALKVFAHHHPRAVNGSMEFDGATLSPTYRFKKGVPGSSYAFEIADRMNLDKNLLAEAHRLLGQAKSSMETLIAELEAKTQQAERLKKEYDQLQAQTETERNRYKEKRSGIENEKEAIREKALKQAQEIMDSANRHIEQAVEKVVAAEKRDDKTIKKARRETGQHKEQINRQLRELEQKKQQREREENDKHPPMEGDLVRLKDGNTTGKLEKIEEDMAVVIAGGLRLKTKYENLVKVTDAHGIQKASSSQANVSYERKFVEPRIDIHGMRGPEAIRKVQKYLDDALVSGRNEVDIMHGKGKGILKRMVHEYLDERKEVKSYRMAPLVRGGAGCTIVEL